MGRKAGQEGAVVRLGEQRHDLCQRRVQHIAQIERVTRVFRRETGGKFVHTGECASESEIEVRGERRLRFLSFRIREKRPISVSVRILDPVYEAVVSGDGACHRKPPRGQMQEQGNLISDFRFRPLASPIDFEDVLTGWCLDVIDIVRI
jgi:hypothetical protein